MMNKTDYISINKKKTLKLYISNLRSKKLALELYSYPTVHGKSNKLYPRISMDNMSQYKPEDELHFLELILRKEIYHLPEYHRLLQKARLSQLDDPGITEQIREQFSIAFDLTIKRIERFIRHTSNNCNKLLLVDKLGYYVI